jgi:Mg2+-importing ATPase
LLLWSTILLVPLTLALPFLPIAPLVGFVPLPPSVLATLIALTALYALSVEIAKQGYFSHDREGFPVLPQKRPSLTA